MLTKHLGESQHHIVWLQERDCWAGMSSIEKFIFFLVSPILLWHSWLNVIFLFLLLWKAKLDPGNADGLIYHAGSHLSLEPSLVFLPTATPGTSCLLVHRRVWRSSGVRSVWRGGTNTGIPRERTATGHLTADGPTWCWLGEGSAFSSSLALMSMMEMDPGQEFPSPAAGMDCVNTGCVECCYNWQNGVPSVPTDLEEIC